jgi:hypothetical protein
VTRRYPMVGGGGAREYTGRKSLAKRLGHVWTKASRSQKAIILLRLGWRRALHSTFQDVARAVFIVGILMVVAWLFISFPLYPGGPIRPFPANAPTQ